MRDELVDRHDSPQLKAGAFRYDAFISYSHADKDAAARLQHLLEGYRLPAGTLPGSNRLRVFRDTTDIRSGDLRNELKTALAESRVLVVCCSHAAADSRWVAEEIAEFRRQGEDRPIAVILLSGSIPEALPGPLRDVEHRYSDLRRGWRLGMLRPDARVEVIRVIALVAGLELRTLIPWDRRRRRQRLAAVSGVGLTLLAIVLALPFRAWDQLDVLPEIRPLQYIVACEVKDGQLSLAARYRGIGPQGGRDYIALYHDALNPVRAAQQEWLERNFSPIGRLLPLEVASRELSGWGMAMLGSQTVQDALQQREVAEANGAWVGEPCPGTRVAIFPLPLEAQVDEFSGPPEGVSFVVVQAGGAIHMAEVDGVPSLPAGPLLPRSFSPSWGLPVACSIDGLWLGMPLRDDQGAGGLWRTTDSGVSWLVEGGGTGVNSIVADPKTPGRLVVSEPPGLLRSGVHELKYAARLKERPGPQADWRSFEGPAHSANSEIELCGFLPDGTLVVRVDEFVYSNARRSTLRRLLDY